MALYTDLSRGEIEEVLQYYSIGSLWTYKHLYGGVANTVYYLSTFGGEYILTICNHKEANDVRLRSELLDHLFRAGLPVPEIVATQDKTPFVFYKDQPIIIKKFIEGSIHLSPNEEILEDLGQKLAVIHETQLPFPIPYRMPYDGSHFLPTYRKNAHFAQWIKDKTRYLEQYIPQEAPIGLIHGDLFPDNYICENRKVKAIIDFEESCQFFLAYDIAIALIGNAFDGIAVNIPLAQAFIRGYEKVRKLKSIEKSNMNYFIAYAASAMAYWRFRQFELIHPESENKVPYEEMMKVADYFESSLSQRYLTPIFEYN